MDLQTANQFQLAPNIASNLGGGVQTGQNIAGQFQLGKQRDQQIQQTEEDATYVSRRVCSVSIPRSS